MCGSRVSSGSGGKGSGPEWAAWISALQGLVKSSIVIPFVGDAGEERLLPETEPGMTFTIVWCTDRVLARIVVRESSASIPPIEGAILYLSLIHI